MEMLETEWVNLRTNSYKLSNLNNRKKIVSYKINRNPGSSGTMAKDQTSMSLVSQKGTKGA